MKAFVASLVVVAGFHLTAASTLTKPYSAGRIVVVKAHTAAHAACSVTDSLTGAHFRGIASKQGTATWRWHPSVWAHGIDDVTVSCARGRAHRSARSFVLLQTLPQISVLRDYAVHLVYWAPDGGIAAEVAPAVAQLEADVKASLDSGATDNPFAVPRAYGDSLGAGDPRIASIDAVTDTDPYPAPAKGYCQGVSTPCLGDPDFAVEVERVARAHRWPAGNHTLVLVFTSSSLTACFRFAPNCTPQTEPGGFHDLSSAGYAYGEIVMSGLNTRSGSPISPADYAIALVGHEQNEAVVDPVTTGIEVGDRCEGQFKPVSINGHPYTLQALELPSTKCSFTYTP